MVTGMVLGIQGLGILQLLEWAILDYGFRRRPVESPDSPVVIITIDDADIAINGQWPFSDHQLAQVLSHLNRYQPAAIGLDLYRDLPIGPGRDDLHHVFASTPHLIGIEKVVGQGGSIAVAPAPVLRQLDQVAFNDLVLDRDGHLRRHIISIRQDGQTKFALGAKLALMYLEEQFDIVAEPLGNDRIRLGQIEFVPVRAHSGGYVNVELGGYQILANYVPSQSIPTLPMRDMMGDRLSQEILYRTLHNKIVFIGLKAESSWGDRFFTPYSHTSDETWAGVEIHANLAAQLVIGARMGRSPLQTWPEWLEWGWILLWASLGVACNRQLSMHWHQWMRLPFLTVMLMGLTYGLFVGSYWIPLISPILALNGAWVMTQGYVIWRKLRQDNYSLEQTVQQRTQELRQQNQDLIQARLEAELANQAKSQFLAHISHELRTPLTAILGFGDLLRRSIHLLEDEKDYVETINQSGEHLLALINNVLELSKIETGAIALNLEPVPLSDLIADVLQMFQAQAMAKDLELNMDLNPNLPKWIEADGRKIRQVLINLVGNAIKFTPSGSVILQAKGYQSGNTTMVECSVQDTGPGLTPAEISKLFQPFVQASAGKKLGKGTGLGLALAQQYIESMDGTIQVSSPHGQGSRFFFQIPVNVLDTPPIAQARAFQKPHLALSSSPTVNPGEAIPSGERPISYPSTTPSSPGKPSPTQGYPATQTAPVPPILRDQPLPPANANQQTVTSTADLPADLPADRVLIVDDELNNRQLLAKWLLIEGEYDIQTVATGIEAIAAFEQWHPQLILLDIHLPDIDGYEVARRIRATCADSVSPFAQPSSSWLDDNDAPIIVAITAGVLQDNYAQLLAAGCDDVLWKPLTADTLFAKLSEYL